MKVVTRRPLDSVPTFPVSVENGHESCEREAKLCTISVKHLKGGNYSQAEKTCEQARRICPRNHEVIGG